MSYSPGCVEAFEAFARQHEIVMHKDDALAAFAANWERARELEECLRQVLAYREGRGEYDLSDVPVEALDSVAFDKWQAIEDQARKLLEAE